MPGYLGVSYVDLRCKHKKLPFEGCDECIREREEARERERARVQDPAWVIEQAMKRHEKWYHHCDFCKYEDDKHAEGCGWKQFLAMAAMHFLLGR